MTPQIITETIKRFLLSGDWPRPYDINCGLCEDFAIGVIDAITGERENETLYLIWIEDQHPRYEHYAHAVICLPLRDGYMYFDSECPVGVTDLNDIPVVKNNPKVMVK